MLVQEGEKELYTDFLAELTLIRSKIYSLVWIDLLLVDYQPPKTREGDLGPFTNYVMHFSLLFDNLPTYSYVFAAILPNIYLIKFAIVMGILLTTHPPQWHNVICERSSGLASPRFFFQHNFYLLLIPG